MSVIEAASLAASISDLTAGSDRATIAEALQIIINARRLPGLVFTRADVVTAAAVQLGRKEHEIDQEFVDAVWARLQPWGAGLTDGDWERVYDAVCDVVYESATAGAGK